MVFCIFLDLFSIQVLKYLALDDSSAISNFNSFCSFYMNCLASLLSVNSTIPDFHSYMDMEILQEIVEDT